MKKFSKKSMLEVKKGFLIFAGAFVFAYILKMYDKGTRSANLPAGVLNDSILQNANINYSEQGARGPAGANGLDGLNALIDKVVDSGVNIATPALINDTILICTNTAIKTANLTALPPDKYLEIINASATAINVSLPTIPVGFNSASFQIRGQGQSLTVQPNQDEFKNSCKIINTAAGYVVLF